ncbi:DUF4439 domain-containing protein, partial [Streptomyces daliensis]|nr:DUF4439 domain-containing protein [Streptomyces daliensis]
MKELDAVRAALAAEHAAVYGYGVVGGRIGDDRRDEAREAYDAHRARRDTLRRAVRDLGGEPEPVRRPAPSCAPVLPVVLSAAAVPGAARLALGEEVRGCR